MFGEVKKDDLGLKYDPQKTIAHVPEVSTAPTHRQSVEDDSWNSRQDRLQSRMVPAKNIEFPGTKGSKTLDIFNTIFVLYGIYISIPK